MRLSEIGVEELWKRINDVGKMLHSHECSREEIYAFFLQISPQLLMEICEKEKESTRKATAHVPCEHEASLAVVIGQIMGDFPPEKWEDS